MVHEDRLIFAHIDLNCLVLILDLAQIVEVPKDII